jgi:hypothetical protein
MKYVLTALTIAALLVPAAALAGGNPEVKAFITFESTTPDNASVVSRVDPAAYTAVTAYVGMTDLGMGTKGASFALSVTPGTFAPTPTFTSLLPGGLVIGTWQDGLTLASSSCMNADNHPGREYIDPVIMGQFDGFYLGTPGDIQWVDHPDYPRWVTDCNSPAQVDYYCVWTNGGVGKDPVAGECEASTPVEASSWSSIKALYR